MTENDIQSRLKAIEKELSEVDRGLNGWSKFLSAALTPSNVQDLKDNFDLLDRLETVRNNIAELEKVVKNPIMRKTLTPGFLDNAEKQIELQTKDVNVKYMKAFSIIQKIADKKDVFPRDLNKTGLELVRAFQNFVKRDEGVKFTIYRYVEPIKDHSFLWNFCIEFLSGQKQYWVQLMGVSDTSYGIWQEPWKFNVSLKWFDHFKDSYAKGKAFLNVDSLLKEIRVFDKKAGYHFITDEDMTIDTQELANPQRMGIQWKIESWNTSSKGNRIVYMVKINPKTSANGKEPRLEVLTALFLNAKKAWGIHKLPPSEQSHRINQSWGLQGDTFTVTHDLLAKQDKGKYHTPFWQDTSREDEKFLKEYDKQEAQEWLSRLRKSVGA